MDENEVFENKMFSWFSTHFPLDKLRHSLGWTIALTFIYSITFLAGTAGNSMVIWHVLPDRENRPGPRLLILNLAIADLFVILFCVPATLVGNIFIPWTFGEFMCKALAYLQGVSVFASVYFLVAVSLDRCVAICRPLQWSRGITTFQAHVVIALIWSCAFVIISPWMVVFEVVQISSPENNTHFCVENWTSETIDKVYFFSVKLVCCYLFPLSLITYANMQVWWNVDRRQLPLNMASSHEINNIHRRTSAGVLKSLMIFTLAFFAFWAPLYVIMSLVKLVPPNSLGITISIAIPFAQLLGASNSCINPFLYTLCK